MENVNLKVCLDLGSDTLKVSFGYKIKNKIFIKKLYQDKYDTFDAYPACALYDEMNNKWLFQEEAIDAKNNYNNLVNIKTLYNILNLNEKNSINYFNQNHFPKYSYKDHILNGLIDKNITYKSMIESNEMTFKSPLTIEEVIISFFENLNKRINNELNNISKELEITFDDIMYIVLYPSNSKEEYINTYKRHIEKVFDSNVLMLDEAKALLANAYFNQLIEKNDTTLFVDVGEEKTSIIVVENDGYEIKSLKTLDSLNCGGSDFDKAIVSNALKKANNVSSLGQDFAEINTIENEYNFINNIKNIKRLLSNNYENELFDNGASATLNRDVVIDINITYLNLLLWSGIDTDDISLPAPKILKYILDVLKKKQFRNIKKIIMIGGGVNYYSFFDYLKKNINNKYKKIVCDILKYNNESKEKYDIDSKIYTTYGLSVGGLYSAYDNFFEKNSEYIKTISKENNSVYQYKLGELYEKEKYYKEAFSCYEHAAKQGNTDAQNKMGECYYYGKGVEQDYKKAVYWFEKAAKQGYNLAQYNLGCCYYYGEGVEQDYEKAVYWYEKAAEQGNADAQNNLGYCYDYGKGIEKDYEKAVYWYELAVKQGSAAAQNNLGICYYNGKGVEQDYEKAVYWFEKAAKQGDAAAQNNLGDCYYNGKGVEQDYEKAVYWYELAAKQGDAAAQNNLGYCYYNGKGVEQDYEKAVYWYELAAKQGDAAAQNNLGYCYYCGEGVEQDYEKAVYWYELAAKQGDADTQYNLGCCYYNGEGVEQDYKKAVYWYEKAAEQGNATAQYEMGECYFCGKGVEQDYKKAVYWYELAVKQGLEYAQNMMGECFYNGYGVEKDYKKAVYWFEKAANQGNADALYKLVHCYYNGEGVEQDYEKAVYWYEMAKKNKTL